MKREAVEATPRKAFTKKQRAEAFLRAGGRCELCEVKLSGRFDIDHILALHHGGLHEPANWRVVCVECHRDKTKSDVKASAKIRRLQAKHDPDRERKPSRLKGRGFNKVLRKKMNGTVERR